MLGLSAEWYRLMAAPWGKFDMESRKRKADALTAYAADWAKHGANPANQRSEVVLAADVNEALNAE